MTKVSSKAIITKTQSLIKRGNLSDYEKMMLEIEIYKLEEISELGELRKIKDIIIKSHIIFEKHLKKIESYSKK